MAHGALDFNAGADLRIRQEIMDNIPGLPGGGLLLNAPRSERRNHIRFRPRVWGELKLDTEAAGKWRIYTRLTDEMRWYIDPKDSKYTWPDEVVLDNLFVEGKGLFDGFLDLAIGRQDLLGLWGLDHVFVDGTPGDGSRTTYADMARFSLNFTEDSRLHLFFLYNADDNVLRWGTERGKHRSLSGLGGGAEPEMDDWGFGAIWDSKFDAVDYKLFAVEKYTQSFYRGGVKHPYARRTTLGAKLEPHLTETLSLQFEGMGQVGRNGDGDLLSGWSAYAGLNWNGEKIKDAGSPFGRLGLHFMSGDEDAAREDGGHSAWDPLWARGVNDSELFLYGTHYGAAWWSNMIYLKATLGFKVSERFRFVGSAGPMFAETRDGLGGGDGAFKGFLSQVRLDVPIITADSDKGERFEVFGHVLAEFFNPGDYFETDRPSWFVRWQLDFKF